MLLDEDVFGVIINIWFLMAWGLCDSEVMEIEALEVMYYYPEQNKQRILEAHGEKKGALQIS